VSAVCTDPDHTGREYAQLLTKQVCRHNLEQGITPFLHTLTTNERAIREHKKYHPGVRVSGVICVLIGEKMNVINIKFLEEAFHMYYEGLHRYAFTMLNDNDMAKDVVQQVFVTLWEKKEILNITMSVKAYLYRAVYNSCVNRQTRAQKHQPISPHNEEQLPVKPEFLSDIRELRTTLEQAIQSLPPQCRMVFLKSREEEKSYPVIARELDISVKTVEAQISKALRILRVALEKHEIK
jgi:RNA polymerase sigma-70 factor (ECF subfamily)